jgi:Uma2 family endonuclease
MPTALTTSLEAPLPQIPRRKGWSREECVALEHSGVFKNERLELVGGELISKMGKNRPHVNGFRVMYLWLLEAFGNQFVDAEAPIDVSPEDNPSNEPEPDLVVLKRECATFVSANPQPKDIGLVVEISDSSLAFDLTVKAGLYARAGIAEYWVLDFSDKRLLCHRNPVGGKYSSVAVYSQDESVAPLSAPKCLFSPSQLG